MKKVLLILSPLLVLLSINLHAQSELLGRFRPLEARTVQMVIESGLQSNEYLFGLAEESAISISLEDVKAPTVPVISSYWFGRWGRLWKRFGFFLLFLLVSLAAVYGVRFMFLSLLSKTKSARSSVIIRRLYYLIRFALCIAIIIMGTKLWFSLLDEAMEGHHNSYLVIALFLGGGSLLLLLLSSLSLPMSFMTMQGFSRKKKDYVLYLRGFSTDVYTSDQSEQLEAAAGLLSRLRLWALNLNNEIPKNGSMFSCLNERALAKAWERHYAVYGVGLPEELESPQGAKRIYLDNASWQEDVLSLMSKAKFILVRIHPKDSCMWEINKCTSLFSGKTIYYIDNIDKLRVLRERMGDKLPPCLWSESLDENHLLAHQMNGEVVVQPYRNSADDLIRSVDNLLYP